MLRPPDRWLPAALALTCVGVLLVGCGERAERGESGENRPAASTDLAVFALAHQPGEGGAAIVATQAQVRAHPDQARVYVALARAYFNRMRETSDLQLMAYVKDALDGALQLAPADRDARQLQIVVLIDDHRFAEAAERARKLIASDATDTTAHLLLSDALLERGDYEGSVDALQQAMDRRPDLRVHARTAYLRWLHGDVEGALESMTDALSAGSVEREATAWCLVEIGVIHWHKGDLPGATAAAERALGLVPAYLPALTLQARVAAARGQLAEAVALMEQVVARRPNVEELLLLAEWRTRQGEVGATRARELLAQAEKQGRHDPLPLALYYARHDLQTETALTLARTAVAKRPTIQAHAALAMALLRAGQLEPARAASDAALALETPDARLHLQRALIERALQQPERAREHLTRALAMNPYADPVLAGILSQAPAAAGSDPTAGAPGSRP